MKLNLSVDEVLTTTRTVRKRLDLSKAVPRAIIEECLELALQAPNGSNLNVWRWIVVDDRATIATIAGIYKAGLETYAKDHYRANLGIPGEDKLMDSAMTLLRVMDRVPAMLIPLMPGRVEGKNASDQAVMWGSIVQAVWSFCLALRARGLGSALPAVAPRRETDVAPGLGIPFEQYPHVGLFPIAYTLGTD